MRRSISLHIFLMIFIQSFTGQDEIDNSFFDYYKKLNDSEERLPEFKDSDQQLFLKLMQLEVINESRRKHRAEPVKLDILASRVANMQCRESALNDFVGHWNLKGEKPYHRYAFAGGVDHVSENAAGDMTTGRFNQSDESISRMMISSHNAFMAEKKPNDGHKQTIIEKTHNWVGIGYYITEQQFRYYEEFIDRYYEFGEVPAQINLSETFDLKVNPGDNNYVLLVLGYYEEFLSPLNLRQIRSKGSYNDYTPDIGLQVAPWEIAEYRTDNWYSIPLKFNKPGLYYIQIYSGPQPYKDGTRFSTEGSLQASGIVIKVLKP